MARKDAYPREFKERAVALYRSSGRSVVSIAKELGIEQAYYADQESPLPAPAGQETG